MAIAAHKALRKMFKWAVAEGKIDKSPMAEMEPPGKVAVRERVLRAGELRDVWNAAGVLGYPFGTLVQLLIATGQRLREGTNATWGEIHMDQRVWLISAERVKADADHERDHLVPLNDRAMRIIESLPEIAPPDDVEIEKADRPLFTTGGVRPVSGFSKAKVRLDKLILDARRKVAQEAGAPFDEAAASENWTNHDLRRTLSTALQALGVNPIIIDLLQAHTPAGPSKASRHYQHWDYYEPKLDAMDLWGLYLDGVIDGNPEQAELVRKANFRLSVPSNKKKANKAVADNVEQE